MNYIDNDIKKGLYYDYGKIRKAFRKLKIPKELYTPENLPFESDVKYYVGVSERSTGKTTNWILWGLVMNRLYNTQIMYIRQTYDMIAPKVLNQFMDVIKLNHYIEKLTDNEFNTCEYRARRWTLEFVEDDGSITRKADAPFMHCLTLDDDEIIKSSLNAPLGDLIIFDEFISKRYRPNEFVTFCNVVKTIIRDRISPIVVMLANTTDRYNEYFREMLIQDEILKIKVNEYFIKQTELGTTVFCQLIGNKNPLRERVNNLYFGFKNPRLASITGGDWAIDNYPHIESEECEVIDKCHYISHSAYLIQLELCHNERLGLFVKAHKANKYYDDSIIYTYEGIEDKRFRHKYGYTKLDSLIFRLYERNKFFYSNNEVGNMVTSYVTNARKY